MPWVLPGWVLSGLSAEGLSHPGGPVAPGNCRDDGGPHAGILPFATTTVPDLTSNPDKAPTAEWLRCQPRYGLGGGLCVGPSDSELAPRGGHALAVEGAAAAVADGQQCAMSWCTLTSQGMTSPRPPPIDRPRSAPGPTRLPPRRNSRAYTGSPAPARRRANLHCPHGVCGRWCERQ